MNLTLTSEEQRLLNKYGFSEQTQIIQPATSGNDISISCLTSNINMIACKKMYAISLKYREICENYTSKKCAGSSDKFCSVSNNADCTFNNLKVYQQEEANLIAILKPIIN